MSADDEAPNLPAQIADALVSIPKGLTPGVVKALDRLLGSAVDIPVAWLAQKKAKIDAQTESYRLVEASIAQATALKAADPETIQRALDVLVRKEYRKQANREAVATAMIENFREQESGDITEDTTALHTEPDDDWLNVFERYAEDASSERLQGLWGRVLAGEVRKPGRYSMRTLRFLSEFSQADALTFEIFSKCAFASSAPKNLVIPQGKSDITALANMESNGLIQGASGIGLLRRFPFDATGRIYLAEENLYLAFTGKPNSSIEHAVIALTPLGQELLSLIPSRDPRASAKAVAFALRKPEIEECYLCTRVRSPQGDQLIPMETLWLKDSAQNPIVEGSGG